MFIPLRILISHDITSFTIFYHKKICFTVATGHKSFIRREVKNFLWIK
ncbi:hypothetical protein HMPREF1987_02124 [Peptostreptococcaceae bacterium oral taxon 113 str. W5053]|nr:hypothetical protein HMPREF1987_02124 [Peptostreptococcaceae bacterium oral taxon 113 str. W5053]